MPARVLEIGAGHGGYTSALLAAGCDVTAVDFSPPALSRLMAKYGGNPRLTTVADPAGDLASVGSGYALVLCVSVLHHVPDYLAFLDRAADLVGPGGSLLTLQDPLWYPRVDRLTRAFDRTAYLIWRVGQGEGRQGFAAMRRRMRRMPQEVAPGAIVYYHVTRRGIDEQAVAKLLASRFGRVQLLSYWSNHLGAVRLVAERAGLENTFSALAAGRAG